MRSIAHRWRAAAFVFLLSAFCLWIIGSSKSFQQCVRDAKRQDAGYALEKGISHLSLMFGRYKACSGVFVTQNHEAIGAISTFVIAVFTITLWHVGKRQAGILHISTTEARDAIKAAQASANAANTHARAAEEANKINREALVSTNRPWIRIDMDMVKGEPVIITSEHIEAAVQIKVTNIGKSPAAEVSFKIELFPDLVAANRRVNNMSIQEIEGAVARYGHILFPEQHFCEKRRIRTSTTEFMEALREAAAFAPAADSIDASENKTFCEGWPAAIAVVWYSIPAAAEPRRTVIVGEIKNTAPGKIGFDGSEGVFTTVAMIESPMGNRAT